MARSLRSDGFQKQKGVIMHYHESLEPTMPKVLKSGNFQFTQARASTISAKCRGSGFPVAGDALPPAVRLYFLSGFDMRRLTALLVTFEVERLLLIKEILHLLIPIDS